MRRVQPLAAQQLADRAHRTRRHRGVGLPDDTLGESTRDGIFHDARIESWILGEGHGGVVRYLAVMLDPKGVVIDRVWDVPTEIPWVPADQCNAR